MTRRSRSTVPHCHAGGQMRSTARVSDTARPCRLIPAPRGSWRPRRRCGRRRAQRSFVRQPGVYQDLRRRDCTPASRASLRRAITSASSAPRTTPPRRRTAGRRAAAATARSGGLGRKPARESGRARSGRRGASIYATSARGRPPPARNARARARGDVRQLPPQRRGGVEHRHDGARGVGPDARGRRSASTERVGAGSTGRRAARLAVERGGRTERAVGSGRRSSARSRGQALTPAGARHRRGRALGIGGRLRWLRS